MTFFKLTDPTGLIPVAEKRLPSSCLIFNQLKCFHKFTDVLDIFISGSGTDVNDSIWIVTAYRRPDWGVWVTVSPPATKTLNGDILVPEYVKEFLTSEKILNWNEQFMFLALDREVTCALTDAFQFKHGRAVSCNPSYLYYMAIEDALKLEIEAPPHIKIKPLDIPTGVPFIADVWPYRDRISNKTREVVRRNIERLPSVGIYISDENGKNKLVCGAIQPGFGMVSMLNTDPEHRRRGYATLAMRHLFKEVAKEGLLPCLDGECANENANKVYREKLGMKEIGKVGFILYVPPTYD